MRSNKSFKRTLRSGKRSKTSKCRGGAETSGAKFDTFVFNTNLISTQPNADPNYEEAGIVHISESISDFQQ